MDFPRRTNRDEALAATIRKDRVRAITPGKRKKKYVAEGTLVAPDIGDLLLTWEEEPSLTPGDWLFTGSMRAQGDWADPGQITVQTSFEGSFGNAVLQVIPNDFGNFGSVTIPLAGQIEDYSFITPPLVLLGSIPTASEVTFRAELMFSQLN